MSVLKDPRVAPDGLYIDVELNVGKNWAEMIERPVSLPKPKTAEVAMEATTA